MWLWWNNKTAHIIVLWWEGSTMINGKYSSTGIMILIEMVSRFISFFSRLFNWINLFLLSFSFLSIVMCIFALNEDFTSFSCSVFTSCVYSGTSTVTYLIFVTVIKYINNIINHYVETQREWGKIFHVTHGCFYLFCCIILCFIHCHFVSVDCFFIPAPD